MDRSQLPPEASGRAPSRLRLEGRGVVVVGAGSRPCPDEDAPPGNGRAIAVLAAREGASVVCVDVDEGALAGTIERIEAEGGRAWPLIRDVTDGSDCSRLVEDAADRLGDIDGLVLNVGFGEGAGLRRTDAGAWDRTFAINLRSHFLVTKAALPRMSEGASIVYIGSIAGLAPGSFSPAYDTSKAGLLGLSRHAALEASRRRIRANVLLPGLIDTPLGRLSSSARSSRNETPIPLGRQGTAWEIAHPAVFLLSGESTYITGQALVVDGGVTALSPLAGSYIARNVEDAST